MRANILIDFESFGELTSHLYELIKQTKKEAKRQQKKYKAPKGASPAYAEPRPFRQEDDNCYGYHRIIVKNDK